MSIHDGHRQRLRARYLEEGLDGFQPHEVLELLLYHCIPRRNTNDLAHLLLKKFGSFSAVLEADVDELKKVPGIGENAALFVSLLSDTNRYYHTDAERREVKILRNIDECGKYLLPQFISRSKEIVVLLCLDAKCRVLCCKQLGEGGVNSAGVPIRKIVETALNANATSVILAHNHPSGVAIPSGDDISATRMVAGALNAVDVILADHMVFADGDYVSMALSGMYDPRENYTSY